MFSSAIATGPFHVNSQFLRNGQVICAAHQPPENSSCFSFGNMALQPPGLPAFRLVLSPYHGALSKQILSCMLNSKMALRCKWNNFWCICQICASHMWVLVEKQKVVNSS